MSSELRLPLYVRSSKVKVSPSQELLYLSVMFIVNYMVNLYHAVLIILYGQIGSKYCSKRTYCLSIPNSLKHGNML